MAVKSYDGGCAVKVFSQSGIQVYNRFAPTVLSDYGYGQGSQSQPRIIAHVTGFGGFNNGPRGSGLQYAQFYRPDQPELLQAHVFNQRDQASCAYEYISAVYDCSNNTGYQISVSRLEQGWGSLKRNGPFSTLGRTSTATPSSAFGRPYAGPIT